MVVNVLGGGNTWSACLFDMCCLRCVPLLRCSPQVDWIGYDGWGMHIPEGYFRFRTGPDAFVEEIRRLGGEDDVRQW